MLNNWASQKEAELNSAPPTPDPNNPVAAGVTPLPKAMGVMDNAAAGMAQNLPEKLGNSLSNMKPDPLPTPSAAPSVANPPLDSPSQNQPADLNPMPGPSKANSDASGMPTPPATNGEQKPEEQPMPGEKIYPGSMNTQASAGQPLPPDLNQLTPPPSPGMNAMPGNLPQGPMPPDAQAQQTPPNSPFDPGPSQLPQQGPQGAQQPMPEEQAKMAEQQYLQDLSGQPKNSDANLGQNPAGPMPDQSKPPMSKLGPVPYEALNQVLVDSEPGYRWNALKEINKAGMAPPDTYNLLCQTAMSDSPLMNPDIPLDTQSQLRQAAFSTLALLDNKQDANIPAIALMKDPKTGRAIKDPKTGQQAYQMLPGLQEAGRTLHDKEEDPDVQLAALKFLQKIIQSHPSDRPALLGIIKGYKTRDANVQALARQIQSGKPMPGDDNPLDAMSKANPAAAIPPANGDAAAAPQQPAQPAFKGRVAPTSRKQFIA